MHILHRYGARELAWVLVAIAAGCSPSAGTGGRDQPQNLGGGGGGSGAVAGSGAAMNLGGSSTIPIITVTDAGRGKDNGGPDGSCAATATTAEQRVVEKQVPVTKEVTTRTPVSLYLMQDQSGSMVWAGTFQFPPGPSKWDLTKTAITAFVNDPSSAGIDVALQYFALGTNACDGTVYATPEVPMGALPGNAQAIVTSFNAHGPSTGTPIEPALRGVTQYCVAHQTAQEKCVAVLLTDGAPSDCSGDPAVLSQIARDAYDQHGVITFTVGMDGADFTLLDAIAAAGHGDCSPNVAGKESCNVTGGAQAFTDALNTIRGTVTQTVTTVQTVFETQQTKLACEFAIPTPPPGKTFEKTKVNVEYTTTAGKTLVYRVATLADCAAKAGRGWYYDNDATPTKILVCPGTCTDLGGGAGDGGTVVTTGPAPRVDIALGCESKRGPA